MHLLAIVGVRGVHIVPDLCLPELLGVFIGVKLNVVAATFEDGPSPHRFIL